MGRLPARELIVVLSTAVVAAFLALFLTRRPPAVGDFVVAGSLAVVGLSVPLAAACWLLEDVPDAITSEGLLATLAGAGLVVLVAAAIFGEPALLFGLAVLAIVSFWAALPLSVGSLVGSRRAVPFRYVLAGWPVAAGVGFAGFVAAGGLSGEAALGELWRALSFLLVAAVVTAGPGALAVLIDRTLDRRDRRPGEPEEART